MHEIGILIEVIDRLENFATSNALTRIDTLVLQIGELSSVIPEYIEECYPAAVDGTLLQKTKLVIETLPGHAACRDCMAVFNLLENNNQCPDCGSTDWEILCGKEFLIKEIIAC